MTTTPHPPTPADFEAAVDTTAALIGLPLDAAHRPGVLTFYALAAQMAQVVLAVPLSPHDESGEVFRPVEPEVNHERG